MTTEPTPSEITERRLLNLLNAKDREALARCETTIREGLATFLDVGLALTEIRTSRLYRGAYKSFEAYCRDRWNMSSRQANNQIAAARVAGMISPVNEAAALTGTIVPAPKSESQARPLVKLRNDPAAVQQVWQQAVEGAGGKQPTAEQVKEAVSQYEEQHRAPAPAPAPAPLPVDPDAERARRNRRTTEANNELVEVRSVLNGVLRQVRAGRVNTTFLGPARGVLDLAQQLVAALENTDPPAGDE